MSRYRHKVWLHRSFVQNRNGFLQICLSISLKSSRLGSNGDVTVIKLLSIKKLVYIGFKIFF